MVAIDGVTRVPHSDRSGTGLVEWDPIDPDTLVSGTPVQRGWLADETAGGDYLVGVWDCTAHTEHPGPYAVDEFMLLLEGEVVMRMPDGTDIALGPGDAFVIPNGLECQWQMPDYARKVFMIVDDAVPDGPDNPALHRISVPTLAPAAEDGPVETARTWFTNAAGRMGVSVRTLAGGRHAPAPAPEHQLLHVLSGGLTLSDGTTEAQIGTGETVYIRAGTSLARAAEAETRLIEASYRPA